MTLSLRRWAIPVVVVLLRFSALPATAATQQPASVRGSLSAGLVGTRIAGHNVVLIGGQALLGRGAKLSVGGFGYGMLKSIRLVDGPAPEDLRLGYGGLVGRLLLASGSSVGLYGGLLLGAGNAQVRAQPIGNQLGSDNFLVLEPRLALTTPTDSPVTGVLGVGYRSVHGVQDLPGLGAADLRGLTITLSVSFGKLR